MTKHIITADENYELTYEDGIGGSPADEGFWLREKSETEKNFPADEYKKITPPFALGISHTEISVINFRGQNNLYMRYKNAEDDFEYRRYRIDRHVYSDVLSHNIYPQSQQNIHFGWHEQKLLSTVDDATVKANYEALYPRNQTPLSQLQQQTLATNLIGNVGQLEDLKQSCTSLQEYQYCLQYLITGQNRPRLALASTHENLISIEEQLSIPSLRKTPLNNQNLYRGHMATLAEARLYQQSILQAELRQTGVDIALPNLNTDELNYLGYVLENPQALAQRRQLPFYQQPFNEQKKVTKLIQALESVYVFNHDPIVIKDDVDEDTLTHVATALATLLNSDYQSYLVNLVHPFLVVLSGRDTSFNRLKNDFLLPLYQAVIREQQHRVQIEPPIAAPKPTQFQRLRVDRWGCMDRGATHADFIDQQFANPHAIFIIPDNFSDAALQDNQRHRRSGRDGLAGPMTPYVTGYEGQTPIYDLATLGIPTGGFEGDVDEAKQVIQHYFSRLYQQVRLGRTIVIPCIGSDFIPAFGTGIFKDNPLTQALTPFIVEEFKKLEIFCLNGLPLDAIYHDAWGHPGDPLPLPELKLPDLAAIQQRNQLGMKGESDLTSAGFRERFSRWFVRDPKRSALTIDDKTETRRLQGLLSNGVQVTIYQDKMLLDPNRFYTDQELEQCMREVIDMYVDAYLPHKPPPSVAYGNDHQKKIIENLFIERGVPLAEPINLSETSETDTTPNPPHNQQPAF